MNDRRPFPIKAIYVPLLALLVAGTFAWWMYESRAVARSARAEPPATGARGDAARPGAGSAGSAIAGKDDEQKPDPPQAVPRFVDPPGPAPEGMAWISGGTFVMGDDDGQPDEAPAHPVTLDGFWMDRTEVTNAQFKKFVDATGYKTLAERTPEREDFRGLVPDVKDIPAENLVAGSICFNERFDRSTLTQDGPLWPYQVWKYVKGANWKHPEGPDSTIDDRMQHPVVHVNWDDAVAYCKWAGKRLPTEAEWEYAARGGLKNAIYPWGNELVKNGKWMLNIWQGKFPDKNEVQDGFLTTAPVASFPANGYGLYDMAGNVWEWCSDFYRPDYYRYSPFVNPQGPSDSFDPMEPQYAKRVQRGGSFMCSDNYCRGYRVAARMKGTPDSGAFHTGFRTVLSPGAVASPREASHDTKPALRERADQPKR
jgi:formylglycine-generating enzyme